MGFQIVVWFICMGHASVYLCNNITCFAKMRMIAIRRSSLLLIDKTYVRIIWHKYDQSLGHFVTLSVIFDMQSVYCMFACIP